MSRPLAESRRLRVALPVTLVAACAAGAAHAQGAIGGSQLPERVDGGVSDRHSLGQSLRVQPVDLSPHGFRNVYKVPGRDDLLMRTDGALYAVFDQSVYVRDPKQKNAVVLKPMIPAATVFYIGRPDFRMIRSSGVRDLSFRREDVDRSYPPLAHPADPADPAVPVPPPAATRADRPGFERRIDELMERAKQAAPPAPR